MKKKNLLVLGIALGIFGGAIQGSAQTVMQEDNIQEVATSVREWKVGTKDNRTEVYFSIPRNSTQLNDSYRVEINNKYYFSVNKQVNYYCILSFIGSMNVYGKADRELNEGDIVTLWYLSGPEAKKIQQIKVDASMLPK